MSMPPVRPDIGAGDGRLVHMDASGVIAGHGSAAFILVSGFVAGLLIWLPVVVVVYFNRLLTMAGPGTTSMGAPSALSIESAWIYWVGTGVVGVALAWLRRLSARIDWYKDVASFRLGLNGVVATVGGAIVCLWLIFSESDAGFLIAILSFGVVIGGFLVNAVWEWLHNLFLNAYGRKVQDSLLERAVRHVLGRYAHLRPKRLDAVTVRNGKVSLKGVWEDMSARREVESELRGIAGVAFVQFERTGE